MTEDQLRELFREMRDEPVPPDSQARVRMAVAARTESWQERVRKYWKAAALILVPATAVLVMMLNRQLAPVHRAEPPVIAREVEPIVAAPALVEVPPPPHAVRVKRRVPKAVSHVEQAATLIRIETPDPDVVILLVGGY